MVFYAARYQPKGQIYFPGSGIHPDVWGHSLAFSGREVLSSTAVLRSGCFRFDAIIISFIVSNRAHLNHLVVGVIPSGGELLNFTGINTRSANLTSDGLIKSRLSL